MNKTISELEAEAGKAKVANDEAFRVMAYAAMTVANLVEAWRTGASSARGHGGDLWLPGP